jgi:thiamine monophosphate kinase
MDLARQLENSHRLGAVILSDLLPLHPVTAEIADFLGVDAATLALGPGADFKIVATVEGSSSAPSSMTMVGEVSAAGPALLLGNGKSTPLPNGWNYFIWGS